MTLRNISLSTAALALAVTPVVAQAANAQRAPAAIEESEGMSGVPPILLIIGAAAVIVGIILIADDDDDDDEPMSP